MSTHAAAPRVHGAAASAVAAAPGVVWEADADDYRMLYVSPAARTILGHDPDRWVNDPAFWEGHIHPDDRAAAIEAADRAVASRTRAVIEYRFQHADGTYVRMLDTMQLVRDEDERSRLTGIMIELGEDAPTSPSAPNARHLEPGFHESIVNSLGDGVYYVDLDRRITYWNQGAERLTGYRADAVVGRQCHDNLLCHVDDKGRNLCRNGCPLVATMSDKGNQDAVVWLRHADGSRRPVHVRTAPIRAGSGEIIGGVEIFSDATGLIDAQQAAAAARQDALTDPLTGLANRRLLDAVLAARKDDLDRHGYPYGFLIVDIDHFKRVNDEHGHDVGDEAIKLVASTIKGTTRNGDSVARWGGEEFAVVVSAANLPGLQLVAERIRRIVRTSDLPLADGSRLPVRVSIGGALARPREPLRTLFARADAALLLAKRTGRDRVLLDGSADTPRLLGARR